MKNRTCLWHEQNCSNGETSAYYMLHRGACELGIEPSRSF